MSQHAATTAVFSQRCMRTVVRVSPLVCRAVGLARRIRPSRMIRATPEPYATYENTRRLVIEVTIQLQR
jgi:hypothetical protein